MSSISSIFANGQVFGLSKSDQIHFSTLQMGNVFGIPKSGSLNRLADQVNVTDNLGGLRALLLLNPRHEFTVTALSEMNGTLPGLGDTLVIPEITIIGTILDVGLNWQDQNSREITVVANAFDTLRVSVTAWADSTSYTIGDAIVHDGVTYEALARSCAPAACR